MRRLPLAIALLGVVGACRHTFRTSFPTSKIGTKYARISGYMMTRGLAPGGAHTETTPGAIRHDAILDEATLAKVDGGQTCVDLVLRTGSAHDEPVGQYELAFEIDGHAMRGVVENEKVSVYDYAFTGMRKTAVIEGVAGDRAVGMSLSQPTAQVFRVIERRARVCCARGGNVHEVKLAVVHPSWNIADYHYRLDFDWSIE